jgi:hypothetical protein
MMNTIDPAEFLGEEEKRAAEARHTGNGHDRETVEPLVTIAC